LEKLYDRVHKKPADPMTSVFSVGMREWRRGSIKRGQGSPHAGLMQRIERVMAVAISREMGRAERYMNFLATVGSVAPFLGLFGTVWGIMNSFTAIAMSNNTNITVVAPGIAEALSTTALGLIAAIPAVVAFNKFNNELVRYGDRLEGFGAEFSSILARHLEDTES
jgi:biopolymer transport protein TolQ